LLLNTKIINMKRILHFKTKEKQCVEKFIIPKIHNIAVEKNLNLN